MTDKPRLWTRAEVELHRKHIIEDCGCDEWDDDVRVCDTALALFDAIDRAAPEIGEILRRVAKEYEVNGEGA